MLNHRNNPQSNTIKRGKRTTLFLLLTLVSLVALIGLVYLFPPDFKLVIGNWSLVILYVFLPLLFLCIFSLVAYVFKSKMHAGLIASFTIIYLIFRLNNLTHPFFLMMLLLLLLSLEFLVSHKR